MAKKERPLSRASLGIDPPKKTSKRKPSPKPPAPLSEAEVNKGIAEYKKLEAARKPAKNLSETVHVPGRKSTVKIGKTGWPAGTEKWAEKSPSIPKPKKLNPKRVGLAASSKHQPLQEVPASPAERRMMRRSQPSPSKGEIKPSLKELRRKVESRVTVRPPASPVPSFKGEIAPYRGAIGHSPEKHTVDAFSSKITAPKPQRLGLPGPSVELKSIKSRLLKGRGGRLAALGLGAAAAVGSAFGAYSGMKKAEAEAQANREAMAVKYASPLTHQRRLREREASRGAVAAPASVKPSEVKVSSPSAQSKQKSGFGSAFAQARKSGLKEFEYQGKKYHTRLAGEPAKVSKVAPQKTETIRPEYDSQKFISNIALDVPEPKKANFGAFLRSKHPKLGTRKK